MLETLVLNQSVGSLLTHLSNEAIPTTISALMRDTTTAVIPGAVVVRLMVGLDTLSDGVLGNAITEVVH